METKKKQNLLFFTCTLLFSWIIWITLALTQVDVKQTQWLIIMMLGGLSPSLFGIIFIIINKSYTKKEFLKSVFSFQQIGIKNILLIVTILFIPFITSVIINYFFFEISLSYDVLLNTFKSPQSIITFMLISIYSGPLTEEFGWRGFATKNLLAKYNILKTGIIVGTIWSLWHLPLFFLKGQYEIDNYSIFILNRFIKEVSLAIIITLFFKKTNNSILVAMLIHGLSNVLVNLFIPISMTRNISHTCILVLVTIILLIYEKKVDNLRKI